jgi:hypothetical protein
MTGSRGPKMHKSPEPEAVRSILCEEEAVSPARDGGTRVRAPARSSAAESHIQHWSRKSAASMWSRYALRSTTLKMYAQILDQGWNEVHRDTAHLLGVERTSRANIPRTASLSKSAIHCVYTVKSPVVASSSGAAYPFFAEHGVDLFSSKAAGETQSLPGTCSLIHGYYTESILSAGCRQGTYRWNANHRPETRRAKWHQACPRLKRGSQMPWSCGIETIYPHLSRIKIENTLETLVCQGCMPDPTNCHMSRSVHRVCGEESVRRRVAGWALPQEPWRYREHRAFSISTEGL